MESLFINENNGEPLRMRSGNFGNVFQMNAASQEAKEAKQVQVSRKTAVNAAIVCVVRNISCRDRDESLVSHLMSDGFVYELIHIPKFQVDPIQTSKSHIRPQLLTPPANL